MGARSAIARRLLLLISKDVLGKFWPTSGLICYLKHALDKSFQCPSAMVSKAQTIVPSMDQPMTMSLRDDGNADEVHNRQNQLLKEGLDALGMHSARTPRNINDTQDLCGYTTFGCARGNKQVSQSSAPLD